MPLSEQEELELLRLKKRKALQSQVQEYAEPTLGEKAKAFGYGAVGGFGGGLGEIEKFSGTTIPEFVGLKDPNEPGIKPFLPTVSDVEKFEQKLGVKKPREEVSGYKTAGELLGGFGTSIPGMVRGGAKFLLGVPSKLSENVAKKAEKLGFKLSPSQVRQDVPLSSKGASNILGSSAKENQVLANELASKGTGAVAKEISQEFIQSRLRALGNEFNQVYQGKIFNIDTNAIDAIREIASESSQIPTPASVKKIANEIVQNYDRLTRLPGANPNTFAVEGEALQRMRNALTESARSSTRTNAHEIYELVDSIDGSVARNHPNVASKLNEIRPKYRNSIILEDLYRNGGIEQGNISLERLGKMISGKRDAVRRHPSDIDELGDMGRTLGLRARWEKEGYGATEGEDVLGKLLGTGTDIVGKITGTRSGTARKIQSKLAEGMEKSSTPLSREAALTTAGTATRPLNSSEEEY